MGKEPSVAMSGNRRRINNDIVPLNPMVIVMRLARGSSQNPLLDCLTYGAVRSWNPLIFACLCAMLVAPFTRLQPRIIILSLLRIFLYFINWTPLFLIRKFDYYRRRSKIWINRQIWLINKFELINQNLCKCETIL